MKYVSLHHHTTFSYMDGYGLPSTHVARAADLGMSAQAVTEHGNVSSHVKHELAAKEHGIKAIFGLEGYMAPRDMRETKNMRKWHQTILAMNEEGLHNLYQLVTRSWNEGFYRYPTIHWDMLRDHSEGLIVTSGCLDSKLACDLLGGKGREQGDEHDAVQTLLAYKRLFGDRFYLETQRFPELQRACTLNPKYEEWGRKYDIPLVATADVHYPQPDDNEMQKILHAAGRNTGTVAAAEASWEYDIRLTHPTSDREILRQLRGTGLSKMASEAALLNTAEIAGRCNVELPKMERVRFPIQDEPNFVPGMDKVDMIRAWMNEGWRYRGFHRLPRSVQRDYKQRAEYELDLFIMKDFIDYFLMLSDTVRHCKDNGLPVGPARGSAAASLVCYLLRITEVNPMEYPLMLFERFVDPNRHDLPDVDLDFDDERRDEVRQYMIQKYGEDRVGNIGTFTRYRGKNSIDDVARVYRVPEYEVKRAKEFLVARSGGDTRFDASIEDSIELYPVVKEVFEKYPKLYNAIRLEGNYKGFGVHAAGLVVGAEPLTEYVATYTRHNVGKEKKTLQALSVDKRDGEPLGLLKLDALGLQTMGMIRNALEIIGMPLDKLYRLPMDDPETLAAFEKADVTGIFQFEGRTMRMVCTALKPNEFMDLAAINALARPGPLHSGSTAEYIAIRNGTQQREDIHPMLTDICDPTEGQIIYQEQILQVCRTIGKFPWTKASVIRKIISVKKGESAFNELWDSFKEGAAENGIDEETARSIWKRMVTAGTYAFNIAHCISYSVLGMWAMWLKVHHPLAFYAAQLRKVDDDKALMLMRDMQDPRFGRSFEVYPPDLNKSGKTWLPAEDGVLAGFSQIPGIGDVVAQKILALREELGGFDSWDDLVKVPGIGTKTMEKIREFCEDDDPFGIHWLQDNYDAIVKSIKTGELEGLPRPTTRSEDIPYDPIAGEHVILAIVRNRQPQDMFENHRVRTGEELDPSTIRNPELKDYMTMYLQDPWGLITARVDRFRYPQMYDRIWSVKEDYDFILCRATKRASYGKTLTVKNMWVIEPD